MKTYEDLLDIGAPALPADMFYDVGVRDAHSSILKFFYTVVKVRKRVSFLGLRWTRVVATCEEVTWLKDGHSRQLESLATALQAAGDRALKVPVSYGALDSWVGRYDS